MSTITPSLSIPQSPTMDENDFDQILHTDFHPNTAPLPTELHHEQQQQQQQQQQHHHEEEHNLELGQTTLHDETPHDDERGISHDTDAYNFAEDIARSGSIDRQDSLPAFSRAENDNNGGPDRELTFEDKKARQRDQNKHAALKSRAKKRDRYNLLEEQVDELSDENEKLRARLAKLQADRPGSTQTDLEPPTTLPPSDTPESKLPELDHQYFRKVVNNLEAHKFTLLSKEMELERFRQGFTDSDTPVEEQLELRERLIRTMGNLILVQAETASIKRMIENLRLEKVNMSKERDTITREVDARMAVKQINGVGGEGAGVDNVEQALLEVRGWLDETIAKWDHEPPAESEETSHQIAA